ncbi:hypothetical protein CC79DRAFT_546902 [Sarocladium strictum]
MRARRARTGELRTRTGCNRCRQRRIKCPEEKPVCAPCRTLGFECSYDIKLKWQDVHLFNGIAIPLKRAVEEWMFMHASSRDFNLEHQHHHLQAHKAARTLVLREQSHVKDTHDQILNDSFLRLEQVKVPSWLSPLAMSSMELYLWTYFQEAIAPTCVLDPSQNPYQGILLRIAASTGKSSPLFNVIMAISARENHILGSTRFDSVALSYYSRAVCLLRHETLKMEAGTLDRASEAQILATVMALMFLDIMSDCSSSWVVHSDFARCLVSSFRSLQRSFGQDVDALLNFVGGYVIVHEVYAHTAWNAIPSAEYDSPVTAMCDDANLQTLTGCSTGFLQILADLNSLVASFKACSQLEHVDPVILASLDQRRYSLEKQLHECAPAGGLERFELESSHSTIAIEIKRLTGLLHLYSRIDHLGPADPCIAALATRILHLISQIPPRSNTILWPLFMVATLGIGAECDDERAFILEKLELLQRKRQMRYIQKARDIITEVWKVRDLRESELYTGWGILEHVAQSERISLF